MKSNWLMVLVLGEWRPHRRWWKPNKMVVQPIPTIPASPSLTTPGPAAANPFLNQHQRANGHRHRTLCVRWKFQPCQHHDSGHRHQPGDHAFGTCLGLAWVTISGSITNIGDGAFWDCTRLSSVTINGPLTSIGTNMFADGTSLACVTILAASPTSAILRSLIVLA